MFSVKFKRHFETYPDFTNKTADYFTEHNFFWNCDELRVVQATFVSHVKIHNEKSLKTSYLVSYELASAETFLKPLLVKVVECMVDKKTANLISQNLSNNTMRRVEFKIYHMMLKTQ